MAIKLQLPPEILARLEELDKTTSSFTELDVSGVIQEAKKDLEGFDSLHTGAMWAEIIAFNLIAASGKSPWETHFGPIGTLEDREGKIHYSPNIADASLGTVEYWESRARESKHPVLQARYADVVWDLAKVMGEKQRNPQMALLATDAYLASLPLRRELYDKFHAAARALELAILIKDEERIERARKALLALHHDAMAAGHHWWFAFDYLIDNKQANTTNEELQSLVDNMEKLLSIFSSTEPDKFNPHDAQNVVKRLMKYYEKARRPDDIKRLKSSVGAAFEHFGNLGDGMTGSYAMQTAFSAYRSAGLTEDSQRARISMEKKIGEARQQMAPIGTTITVTKQQMDEYLEILIVEDAGQTLVNIACEFLSNQRELEERVQKLNEQSPLMAMMPMEIMAENRVVARIGSVEDDPEGHLLRQASMNFALSNIWLHQAMTKAIEVHGLTPEQIVTWINRSDLFEDTTLLLEGIKAWFERDFIKATHILVPQIEHGLRQIVAQLGKPITKAHPRNVPGASVMLNMGDILNDQAITEALGPDFSLHMLAFYADPRGRNVRNELAHGLMSAEEMNESTVQWLIHTLLILGIWKEISEKRR